MVYPADEIQPCIGLCLGIGHMDVVLPPPPEPLSLGFIYLLELPYQVIDICHLTAWLLAPTSYLEPPASSARLEELLALDAYSPRLLLQLPCTLRPAAALPAALLPMLLPVMVLDLLLAACCEPALPTSKALY